MTVPAASSFDKKLPCCTRFWEEHILIDLGVALCLTLDKGTVMSLAPSLWHLIWWTGTAARWRYSYPVGPGDLSEKLCRWKINGQIPIWGMGCWLRYWSYGVELALWKLIQIFLPVKLHRDNESKSLTNARAYPMIILVTHETSMTISKLRHRYQRF